MVVEILWEVQRVEFPPGASVRDAAGFPAEHQGARGQVETAGPDARDDGGLGFAGAEGDDGVGEADEREGGVGGVEEVLVEVLDALAGGDEAGAEGGEEGEGVEVAGAEEDCVDVGFGVVVCEADGLWVRWGRGEEFGDFGEGGGPGWG